MLTLRSHRHPFLHSLQIWERWLSAPHASPGQGVQWLKPALRGRGDLAKGDLTQPLGVTAQTNGGTTADVQPLPPTVPQRAAVMALALTNGQGTTRALGHGKRGKPVVGVSRARRWITVGMGCGIPCLSLSLSSIGGRLLVSERTGLGLAMLGLTCGVLAVSLSHLAWAVKDITGSARWQAWCLAVAIDASLVLGELAVVSGFDLWVVPVVMGTVTVVSAVLNCWAFLRHCK